MATEIAKAYVQIVPSTQGMEGKLKEELGSAGDAAGNVAGLNIAGKLKGVLAAAGIGAALKASLSEGANFEQLTGGVVKIFEDSSEAVIKNAKEAYTTAGISANEYMEQVTSFSASLMQSVSGGTQEAANIADMAIRDMADNANVYGSSMESIQNAYQGFAKQNYTMLDNLKLGYGGTKTEMERLLADAEALTGVHYDIDNLADVYSAIHEIQVETGITGTTSEEAAKTFSGSMSSVQASAKNVLTALATGDGMQEAFTNLMGTSKAFLVDNFLPMIGRVVSQIPEFLSLALDGLSELIPPLLSGIVEQLAGIFSSIGDNTSEIIEGALKLIDAVISAVIDNLPLLLDAGVKMVLGIVEGIIKELPNIITTITDMLVNGIPLLIDAGIELLQSLVEAIPIIIPIIIQELPAIIEGIVTGLLAVSDVLVKGSIQLLMAIIDAIPTIILELYKAVPKIVETIKESLIGQLPLVASGAKEIGTTIVNGIKDIIGSIRTAGGELIKGLWNGINDKVEWIKNKIKGFGNAVMSAIKGIFGIKSPSRKMRDEVGKNIALGMAAGITENLSFVEDAMNELSEAGSFEGTINTQISKPYIGQKTVRDITIHVYPSEGMDEDTLLEKMMRKLSDAYTQEEEAYA